MDCAVYANGTMQFNLAKSDASSCYSSDNPSSVADSDASRAASSSSLCDVVKCCVCLAPAQLALSHTMPSCLHVFCSACLERVSMSPAPESCPLCLAEMHPMEAMTSSCVMCCKQSDSVHGRCVHCNGFLCEECSIAHDQSAGYENHIVLKMTHPALYENGWKAGEDNGWNSVDVSWPGDPSHSDKSWNNGGLVLEHSWANSISSDSLWMNGENNAGSRLEKKWMQSTAKKGWSSTMPQHLLDPSDDDSLALYSTGESSNGTSSSAELHSLYDQVIVPGAMPTSELGLTTLASEVSKGYARHKCLRHESEPLTTYCKTCEAGVCDICVAQDNSCAKHDCIGLHSEPSRAECSSLLAMRDKARAKTNDLTAFTKSSDDALECLQNRYRNDDQAIRDAFDFYLKALLDRRQEMGLELQAVYGDCAEKLSTSKETALYNIQQLTEAVELIRTLLLLGGSGGCNGQSQLAHIFARLCETLEGLLAYCPNLEMKNYDEIAFISNQQAIQAAVRNTFGYVRRSSPGVVSGAATFQCPIKKVFSAVELSTVVKTEASKAFPYPASNSNKFGAACQLTGGYQHELGRSATDMVKYINGAYGGSSASVPAVNGMEAGNSVSGMKIGTSTTVQMMVPQPSVNLYENRSAALRNGFSIITVDSEDEMSKVIMPSICPSDFKRKKMEYHCKFGEFGSESHQFYEPSGVAVTTDNDILVADANNHRIQAFDRNGNYLRTIGQDHRGGGEGDLVYPNRLTVNRTTGDIIVTERSPTHQVNVYNKDGRFVRKFGASILQHPRGITVDNLGRIIVVECKVMRVVIFSVVGSVLNRFIVDKHVNFPNGVAVNDREEIFISDNRRHGVVVFDYHGSFLRTVGGMGITNYPIGVGINMAGEVVVADNHNNFNVTVFTQDGVPIRALESRVKHAQCFDIALLDRGSIVLSSKDFRVYVYQYFPSSVPLNPLAPPMVPQQCFPHMPYH